MEKNNYKLTKNCIFLFIVILISCLLVSCAQEPEEPEEIIYYDDQQYSIEYDMDNYHYRMELDGASNCQIFKSYTNEAPIVDEGVEYRVSGTSKLTITQNDYFNSTFYILDDRTLVEVASNPTPPENYQRNVSYGVPYTFTRNVVEGASTTTTIFTITFAENGECRIEKRITMPEYKFAEGLYSIKDHKYVDLKTSVDTGSIPVSVYSSMEYIGDIGEDENGVSSKVDENGLIKLQIGFTEFKYVQLYDDGTFEFVVSQTMTSPEVCFTSNSYENRTYSSERISYYNGDRYKYAAELSFTVGGAFSYHIKTCELERYYKIVSATELEIVYYDIDQYNKLIGTHAELNTSNNFAVANTGIIYVAYLGKNYQYTGLEIQIQEHEDYIYICLVNDTAARFYIYYYEDGTWEWDTYNIRVLNSTTTSY